MLEERSLEKESVNITETQKGPEFSDVPWHQGLRNGFSGSCRNLKLSTSNDMAKLVYRVFEEVTLWNFQPQAGTV